MAPPTTDERTRRADTSHEILDGILNSSREGILVVDTFMRVAAANEPASDAFGRQVPTLHGRRLTEIIRDLSLHECVARALRDRQPSDLRVEHTGNEKRVYDVHVAPVDIEGQRHAVGVFYDITQTERLETMRQEFLSNISHELRTPLTSILAYVETLEDGGIDDSENNRRFLTVIRRNAERMNALISDISELSLIETGNITIDVRRIHPSPVVDEIFAALSSKAAERHIDLINQISHETTVGVDPMRLEQMLTNLIDNAIKFNRPRGSVTVSNDEWEGKSRISVADTGEGLRPEHLQRIFERFYRVDRSRSRDAGGTGLGLAIVKHLARLHGGDVLVNSMLGRGTIFTIEL